MTSDIEKLFPGKELVLAGETVKIVPIKLGQLPKAIGLFMKIGTQMGSATDMAVAVAEGGDELLDFVASSIGKPRAWVDELNSDDGMELLLSFFEVNKSFFVEKVLPKFPGLQEKLSNFQKPSSS